MRFCRKEKALVHMPMAKNENKNTSETVVNMWCTTCGDTSLDSPQIRWKLKDEKRGIGICCFCAEVIDEKHLVLPDKSEDGYATFK